MAVTLSEWLRGRSDDQLIALLAGRPDLATPVPADVSTLAARSAVRVSVARALEHVDQFSIEVAQALSVLPESVDYPTLERFCAVDVRPAVERLRELTLVWGDDSALRLLRAVRELAGSYPLGLGRPLADCLARHNTAELAAVAAAWDMTPAADRETALSRLTETFVARLPAVLADLTPAERGLLDRLAPGPPLGQTAGALAPAPLDEARTPIERLLARALLVRADADTVELPREVGLALRGDRPAGPLHPLPPERDVRPVGRREADRTGALAAAEIVRLTEQLLDNWGEQPPAVLRSGGLGVRELRAAAKLLDVPEPTVALVIESSYAAGLLDNTAGAEQVFVPTTAYDRWRQEPVHERWSVLAAGWLTSQRVPSLVGDRDEVRDRPLAALSSDLSRTGAAEIRRDVLVELATAAPGDAPTVDAIRGRLAWRAAGRASRLRSRLAEMFLAEAAALGISGRGALTSAGRALLGAPATGAAPGSTAGAAGAQSAEPGGTGGDAGAGGAPGAPGWAASAGYPFNAVAPDPAKAAEALRRHLPEPVDELIVQADLTALAPGPLSPDLSRQVALMADVESPGAATLYRFREVSIRRALDAGRTAEEILGLLSRLSRTPLPQPLTYLVEDVARRHGRLRVGTATSYLRCDDPALVAEVAVARKAQTLGLRRIAPSVLVSSAPVARVLETLRTAGYAPVAEGPDGVVRLGRAESHL